MTTVKRIVCLANSRKHGERCVAGKEIIKNHIGKNHVGGWIRPVSNRETGALSRYDRTYEGWAEPLVLDVIEISLIEPQPKGYQQENWLTDATVRWKPLGFLMRNNLPKLVDPIQPLWPSGYSTRTGRNDYVPLTLANDINDSLRFLHVDQMEISVFCPNEDFGDRNPRVQGWFHHAGEEYRMWITDPVIENAFLQRQLGNYVIHDAYLSVSLGEPFNDACYKLIAAIISGNDGGEIG